MSELLEALSGSLASERAKREASEKFLEGCRLQPGFLEALLSTVVNNALDSSLRITAAITLKNEVKKRWLKFEDADFDVQIARSNEGQKQSVYSEEEKQKLRALIVPAFLNQPLSEIPVRRQLEEAISCLIINDFPQAWPDVARVVIECLHQRENVALLCSGLAILRRIVGKFELQRAETPEEAQVIMAVVNEVLSLMLNCVSELGDRIFINAEAAYIIKMVCKIYYSITNLALLKAEALPTTLDSYMALLRLVIVTPIPEALLPMDADPETCSTCLAMKAKKWALATWRRFFTRFATSKTKVNKATEEAVLAKPFAQTHALKTLEVLLAQEVLLVDTQRAGGNAARILIPRLQATLLDYFTQGLELAAAYQIMKPRVEYLITQVVHPLLCYNDDDVDEWETDPMEYIRSQLNLFEISGTPRDSASSFLAALMRLRAKDFLGPITDFVSRILQDYAAAAEKTPTLIRSKDGALTMLGAFASRLTGKKRQAQVEGLIEQHILPELVKNTGDKFLRRRAALTVEQLLDEEYCVAAKEGTFAQPAKILQCFQALLQCCTDAEVPVKVAAAGALCVFFSIPLPPLQTHVRANIVEIMDLILAVMESTDHESAVRSLEALVTNFQDEVPLFATKVVDFLVNTLLRLAAAGGDVYAAGAADASSPTSMFTHQTEGLDDDNHLFAISVICRTVTTIITILSEDKYIPVLVSLVPSLERYIDLLTRPNQSDYFQDAMEALSTLMHFLPTLDRRLWKFYERIYQAVCGGDTEHLCLSEGDTTNYTYQHGYALEDIDSMISTLDNFVYKDRATFLSGRCDKLSLSYKEMFVKLVKRLVSYSEDNADPDSPMFSLMLIWTFFDNFCDDLSLVRDMIVPLLEVMWEIRKSLSVLKSSLKQMSNLYTKILCTLAYADTEGFFSLVNQLNLTDEALPILTDASNLKTNDGRKIFLLAFVKIIRTLIQNPQSCPSLPQQLRNAVPSIIVALSKQTMELIKASKSDNDSDDDDQIPDSEQELESDEDAEAQHLLSQAFLAKLQGKRAGENDDDDDDDDFDEYDMEPEQLGQRHSPLDSISELEVIKAFLQDFEQDVVQVLGTEDAKQLSVAVTTELLARAEPICA